MSTILDALRRAEAERERDRGQVPGLNAQPLVPQAAEASAGSARRRWAVLALGVVLAAAAALWLGWPTPPAVQAPAVTLAARPEPVSPPASVALARPAAPAAPAITEPPPPPPVVPPPAPVAAPPVAPPIVPLAQLPADVRQQLPALSISGAIYSDQPASRMLIVNGQLMHEGDRITPDTTLEEIRPKSVVLRHKQWRYEMPV